MSKFTRNSREDGCHKESAHVSVHTQSTGINTAYRKFMKYMFAFLETIDSVSIIKAMCSRIKNQKKLLYDYKYNHGLLHHYLDIKDKPKKTDY